MNFNQITTRQSISSRGGGIEISLDTLGFPNGRMSAYQNYLGGGMLGKVQSDCNIKDWQDEPKLVETSEELKRHFHELTNPDSEWEGVSYEQNQNMPVAGY